MPDRFVRLRPDGAATPELEALLAELFGGRKPSHFRSLKGGITNQLLQFRDPNGKRYLVRAFGRGTDAVIDRDREFAMHQQLMTLNLAPALLCRFGNGLVYEFFDGRPLDYTELSHPDIMVAVADRLAQWHGQLRIADINARLPPPKVLGDLWGVLGKWISIAPEDALPISPTELQAEFAWIKKTLRDRGGPTVVGHCDLLAGNVLCPVDWKGAAGRPVPLEVPEPYVPSTLLTFIDYEYALPVPWAFDIANHFAEWQGYACDRTRVPLPSTDNDVLVAWARHYLRAYKHFARAGAASEGGPAPAAASHTAEMLISELAAWWGMPGFYWGIWSAIQSRSSEIDFDYASYAKERFQEYLDWKAQIWPTLPQ